ncbi:MAG: L,D-transpeptidase [Xanthobacteraceae bacterium]
MKRPSLHALILNASVLLLSAAGTAVAGPLPLDPNRYPEQRASSPAPFEPAQVQLAAAQPNMGGGFLEFLFSGGNVRPAPQYGPAQPAEPYLQSRGEPARPAIDPRYQKQLVRYDGNEKPGTVIIDTQSKFLYLVQGNGEAMRYGVGVGRPGFLWSGVKHVSAKREWPDWTPPAEMLQRRPDLPRHMEGGPENPLGARAMYLGSSLYRIHGSNEPWTIGTNVSSGCIRMRNEDVVDLYERVRVGTKVVVM